MSNFINFLIARKALAFSLCIIYYLLVVLPHNEVGAAVNDIFSSFSRAQYNGIVVSIFSVIIIALIALGRQNLQVGDRDKVRPLIILTLLFIVLCFFFLMVVYVESVHFIQYALFSILLFPLLGRYTSTMIWGAFLGGLDELFQYLILENTSLYYDFNDIVLDAVGAGAGLVILFVFGMRSFTSRPKKMWKRPEVYLPFGVMIIITISWMLGYFSLNYNYNNPAYFTLFKQPLPQDFWFYPPGPPARFHILTPIPALIILSGLILFYGRLDSENKYH